MQPCKYANVSYSLHFLVIAIALFSFGKGEVSGSSPDEGMSKSIATTDIIRNKVRLTYSQIYLDISTI